MTVARKGVRKSGQGRSRRPLKGDARASATSVGRRVVLQIDIRPELKRVLQARALDAGMTLQAYVLRILRDAGLPVRRDDMLDRRKHENRDAKPMPTNASRPKQRSATVAPKEQAASPELLERLGLDGVDGLGACIVVVNVDGGRLRKKARKRVAKSRSRRHLARRRKSK